MLRPEIICQPERLHALSGPWMALADSIGGVSPFQLPGWQLTWWKHFGSGQLRCFAFWEEERLVGLVPAFCHPWNGRRQLTLIGSGLSDYLDPCLLTAECIDALSDELQNDPDWDVCDWQDLSATTPLRHMRGLSVDVRIETPCSAIPLSGEFDSYWRFRSADLRRNIKRYARKAEAEGPLVFKVLERAEPALLDALIRLHGERWQRQGEAGMVEVNRSGDFLREISGDKSCRLFSLEWKGAVVAASAGFLRGKTVYSYLSAFDPQYESLGFGRNLLYQSLRWAFEQGYERWDFLRGDEAYKASWGAVQTQKCRLLITRL